MHLNLSFLAKKKDQILTEPIAGDKKIMAAVGSKT